MQYSAYFHLFKIRLCGINSFGLNSGVTVAQGVQRAWNLFSSSCNIRHIFTLLTYLSWNERVLSELGCYCGAGWSTSIPMYNPEQVPIYIHICTLTFVCMPLGIYRYIYIYIYTWTHMHKWKYMSISTSTPMYNPELVEICIYIRTCTCIYIPIGMFTYIYTHIHVCTYQKYVYVCRQALSCTTPSR